jgi:hypothetical protein
LLSTILETDCKNLHLGRLHLDRLLLR